MTLFLTVCLFYSIFTQVPKSFNSTVALQVGFLKHLGDVATVLLDLACLSLFCFFMSFQTDWMMIRSDLCVELWLLSDYLCKQKSHCIITINGKMNVWKCWLIFTTDTLQQKKIELKPILAGKNTNVLIILATAVYIRIHAYVHYIYIYIYIKCIYTYTQRVHMHINKIYCIHFY